MIRFGAFLADMQNADTLLLENIEDDDCQCSMIDVSDIRSSMVDLVLDSEL